MADATIPLQIAVPGAGTTATSPLDTVAKFAGIQNALNQATLFRQTFAARQGIGQIMANSPDLDTAFDSIGRSPYAAFAPEVMNAIREMQLTGVNIARERQGMAMGAANFTLKGMTGILTDPSQFADLAAAGLATTDPSVQPQVKQYLGAIGSALTHGLPSDPAARASALQSRVGGLLMGSGVTPEVIRAAAGTLPPSVQVFKDATGAERPYVVGGPAAGGGANVLIQLGTSSGAPAAANPFAPAVKPGAPLGGPGLETAKAAEGAGAAAGQISEEMASRAQMLPAAMNRINLMTDSLGQFQAGGGAEFRAQLAKGLQALQHAGLPIPQSAIDSVGNSDLAATQVFNSQVKPYVIGQLKEVAQGTGRVMRSEVDAFIASLEASTDPKAIMEIMNLARRNLQIGYDQSVRYTDFRQALARGDPSVRGLGPSDFFTYYNRNPKPMESPPNLDLGPVPLSRAKGAVPPKQWIVKGGKLVPAESP